MKSCNKRPVTAKQIENLVDDVENTLIGSGGTGSGKQSNQQHGYGSLKGIGRSSICFVLHPYIVSLRILITFIDELEKMLSEKHWEFVTAFIYHRI